MESSVTSEPVPDIIMDPEVLKHLRGGILLAAAAGIMIHLQHLEPAEHTKRSRELRKAERAIYDLFDLYPKSDDFNMQDLGCEFFNAEHEERLRKLFERGVEILPPTEEDIEKCKAAGIEPKPRAVFKDRWKRGDVLQKDRAVIVIQQDKGDEYHYVQGAALLYSKANHPKDPLLLTWKKIDAFGEECSDQEIRESMWAQEGSPF